MPVSLIFESYEKIPFISQFSLVVRIYFNIAEERYFLTCVLPNKNTQFGHVQISEVFRYIYVCNQMSLDYIVHPITMTYYRSPGHNYTYLTSYAVVYNRFR